MEWLHLAALVGVGVIGFLIKRELHNLDRNIEELHRALSGVRNRQNEHSKEIAVLKVRVGAL